MKIFAKIQGVGLAGLAAVLSVLAISVMVQAPAQADAPNTVTVDDFRLPDQNLLARQLYRMGDAKAVVLITYASGDAAVRAEASTWMP